MLVVYLLLLFVYQVSSASSKDCDLNTEPVLQEGINGETAVFPWLGLLRVYLPEERLKLAVTGIVLVKQDFAIVNADDVARIPRLIFQRDVSAMFIPRHGEVWFSALKRYVTHPEYDQGFLNTLALVQLDPRPDRQFTIKPICWPQKSFPFDSSDGLYAIGYTDGVKPRVPVISPDAMLIIKTDNKIMEKFSARMHFVKRKLCREHYQRLEMSDKSVTLAHHRCAYAKNEKKTCVWEHGMALASNVTSHWTLVGFGVRGPGCGALARFIDVRPYLPWMETATAFDEGLKKIARAQSDEDIPLSSDLGKEFDIEQAQSRYFSIDRISPDAFNIINMAVPGSHGNCSSSKNKLVYRDHVRVTGNQRTGFLSYKLSLYDLKFLNYTCVNVKLHPASEGIATIYWMTQLDNMEGASFSEYEATHIKYLTELLPPSLAPTPDKDSENKMQVYSQSDSSETVRQENWNIYLRLEFEEEAMLKIDIYGPKHERIFTTRTTTTTEPTTTEPITTEPTTTKVVR